MATTNLNLTTIAGTDSPANFPATYNDALDKIDAFAGTMASAVKAYTASQATSGGTLSYTFTASGTYIMVVSRTSGGSNYLGLYLVRCYLRSGSGASGNFIQLKEISAPSAGISNLAATASTSEASGTISCTTTATYMNFTFLKVY